MLVEDEEIIDIDNEETITYECENCGSQMVYDPSTYSLTCTSCTYKILFNEEETVIIENDFFKAIEEQKSINIDNSNMNEVECKSCGAILMYDANLTANTCIYCGSAHVVEVKNDTSYIAPQYIAPFNISKDRATSLFDKWCKSNFYMDRKFKKNIRCETLNGIYIPYWTYDANTKTVYNGLKGVTHPVVVTRVINGERQTVTELRTTWLPISGVYNHFFDDILVPAVSNTVNIDYSKLCGFRLNDLVAYDEKYISGFLAKKYEFTLNEGWNNAKFKAESDLKTLIQEHVNANMVSSLNLNVNYSDITYKHILLPIWILGYTHKGKVYNFLINGQSGYISGSYPFDKVRVFFTGVICFIIVALLYTLIYSSI